jgi:hypothetical protein
MLVLLLWPIWYGWSRGGFVGPPPAWSLVVDPYYLAFAPYSAPGRVGFWDYVGFFAAALGASAALAVVAVWRMRPVARRGTDESRREPRLGWVGRMTRWLPGPALDGNPVLWREWHRSRPSRWLLILVVLIGGSTGMACLYGAFAVWVYGMDTVGPASRGAFGVFGSVLQLIFGLLMLSAIAPMAMSEERQRGSLDLLAATTLSTRTIVLGKWLGTLRHVAILALGPGLVGFALATAVKPPRTVPPGASPMSYEELPLGLLLTGASLMVATILVHGALIASVGLALATWIARQSRAIALSVGCTVMIGAGWPFLIGVSHGGPGGRKLMCLSPVWAFGMLVDVVSIRLRQFHDALWWAAFYDLECLVLALGLLWLSVRTFDGCFGRIPERPRRAPVLADVVVVLAGLLGIGGLYGAIAIGIKGAWVFTTGVDVGVIACAVLVGVGLLMLSAPAAWSMSRGERGQALDPEPAAVPSGRRMFAIRWWEDFRLVLLLAIGPALVALALATAPEPFRVVTRDTAAPGGGRVRIETDPYDGVTRVTTTDRSGKVMIREATAEDLATAERVVPGHTRGESLAIAAVAIITILAHGAAIVSLGAALGVWIRRRGRAIAASVGLVLLVTVGWPILSMMLFFYVRGYPWGLSLSGVIPAFSGLLLRMVRPESVAAEITAWVESWDAILILTAATVSWLAIRTLDRRSRGYPGTAGPPTPAIGCSVSTGPEAAADPELAEHSTSLPMSTL